MKDIVLTDEIILIAKSGLFDKSFYLQTYGDIAEAEVDALYHYCASGWREGRDPARYFVTKFYLDNNPDVAEAGVNPLLHFLLHGKSEGRITRRDMILPAEPIPSVLSLDWKHLQSRSSGAANIDVIVPVYRGYNDTKACLYSVLSSINVIEYNLIVVNDCSPEPRLTALLRALAKRNLFSYIENDRNCGFTLSVNKAMQVNPQHDKILLNSDTVVFDYWLDRIAAHASSDPSIGTITPLSNNATICSYPLVNKSNNYSIETPFRLVDLIASFVNKGFRCDVPTGIGFCMYIRAKCISEIGYLDVETFNRGYGEENDFCRRAAAAKWRNVAIGDVFVRHTGEVSFAMDAASQQKTNYKALIAKHPTFETEITRYVNRDPLRAARMAIDVARIFAQLNQFKDHVIFVSHILGGGTETHIHDLCCRLESEGTGVLMLRPSRTDSDKLSLSQYGDGLFLPNLESIDSDDFNALILPIIFKAFKVSTVHVHSLVGFDISTMNGVLETCAEHNIGIVATLHDFSPLCPRACFVDDGNDYCTTRTDQDCNECLRSYDAAPKFKGISNYRIEYKNLLPLLNRAFVPSKAAADIFVSAFPNIAFEVRKHLETDLSTRLRSLSVQQSTKSISENNPLHVVSIGAIGPHKGSRVLLRCAIDAKLRGLPIKFSVIGYSDIDRELVEAGVLITGKFSSEAEAIDLVGDLGAHVALLPSIWPETYMYTLSTALKAGLFPVAFDIGAQSERIRDYDFGALIDIKDRFNAPFINSVLLEAHKEAGVAPKVLFGDRDQMQPVRKYYGYEG